MIAVYPGTFDPVTSGHLDIIARMAGISQRLYVAVLDNVAKKTLFTAQERLAHLAKATAHLPNVETMTFDGLQVELCMQVGANVIIRGLRGAGDLPAEQTIAYGNTMMCPQVETLFVPTSAAYAFLSSSLVREIAAFGGNISGMVPPDIEKAIHIKMKSREA